MLFNDVVETHCYVVARMFWLQSPAVAGKTVWSQQLLEAFVAKVSRG